jgi:hypothetical protein
MREPDEIAAAIKPEARSDRLDKNTNWMDTPVPQKKGGRRRYTVGKKAPRVQSVHQEDSSSESEDIDSE